MFNKLSFNELTTTKDASANYKKQEGTYFDALLKYTITYDKRNSAYRPSRGFVSNWTQELPLLSDGMTVLNGYRITGYKEMLDEMILTMSFSANTATSIRSNTDVRVSKRLFISQNRLRGFKSGKVGPKDVNDFVGGNYSTSFNAQTTLPFLFPTFEKIDFLLFFDAANLWHVDYSKNVDQGNEIRSSTGVGVNFISPIGPLNFSLSKALTQADTDQTETFRFNLGTTF